MDVDKNDFGFDALDQLIGDTKRVVVRGHENPALQVDNRVGNISFTALVQAPSGHARRIVRGTQYPARRTMGIPVSGGEIVDDLPLIPDMVSGGQNVDAHLEQFLGEGRSDSEASGSVLTIGKHKIDGVLFHQRRKALFDNRPSRPAEDVTNKKNAHEFCGASVTGVKDVQIRAKFRWYHEEER